MKKIEAIIERSTDGTCTIYCENEMFSGVGKSLEEAKADYLHGRSNPRKKQVEKIEKTLHSLGAELMSIAL